MTSEPASPVRAVARALALAAVGFLAGCAARMDAPSGFLRLEAEGWRAVTADDARLWLREFDDPERGALEFWTQALLEDFTRNRGYAPVGAEDVRDRDGRVGRLLEFTATVDGERFGYLIALWSLDGDVRTVEFTAREEVYAQHVAAVRRALATVR